MPQVFQAGDHDLMEQKAVLPAQCSQLTAIRTLRLDCFSEMKVFPPQVLHPLNLSATFPTLLACLLGGQPHINRVNDIGN